MDTLIVITGPTAVGKTELCIDIAKRFGIPIINADSRQIYRELRIGTATPTEEQLQAVKHFFVGSISIDDYYNASMYEQEVLQLLDEQFKHSPIQLLTGGSMMYIDAVCNGIDDIPTIREDIREEMKRRYEQEGLEALCEDLKRLTLNIMRWWTGRITAVSSMPWRYATRRERLTHPFASRKRNNVLSKS